MTSYIETTGLAGTTFSAFNDTNSGFSVERIGAYPEQVIALYNQSGSGMNTAAFDKFRQGVEMSRPVHVYGTTQPKLWSGNLAHRPYQYNPYGQMRSWTEFENTTQYYDNTIPFDPVFYIKAQENGINSYPFPIYFNDGPQEGEEAAVEPLTIPFRLQSTVGEGAFPIHRPKGNLEDGNPTPDIPQSNNRVLQFIEYNAPLTSDPFLDAGQQYIGDGPIEDDIIIEGYVDFNLRLGDPFDDTETSELVDQLVVDKASIDGLDFIEQLKLLHINLDDDIRETYTQKSATAGYTIYGPDQARYGTDSLTYSGWSRGS